MPKKKSIYKRVKKRVYNTAYKVVERMNEPKKPKVKKVKAKKKKVKKRKKLVQSQILLNKANRHNAKIRAERKKREATAKKRRGRR